MLEPDAVRPTGGAQLGAGDLRPDLVSVAIVDAVFDLGVQGDDHVVGGGLGEEGHDDAVTFDRRSRIRVRRRTNDASKHRQTISFYLLRLSTTGGGAVPPLLRKNSLNRIMIIVFFIIKEEAGRMQLWIGVCFSLIMPFC